MPNADDILTRRRQIRNRVVRAREALSVAERARLNEALSVHLGPLLEQLDPTVLGFCWPFRAEPDLRELVARWLCCKPQRKAALPQAVLSQAPLQFRQWLPGSRVRDDRHGIPYPPDGAVVQPEVLLIPLNAFDARGFRLGYGGGYFDRTLAALNVCAVGVGFELGRVDTVYPQPHDCPMDWLVTEAGVARPERRNDRG